MSKIDELMQAMMKKEAETGHKTALIIMGYAFHFKLNKELENCSGLLSEEPKTGIVKEFNGAQIESTHMLPNLVYILWSQEDLDYFKKQRDYVLEWSEESNPTFTYRDFTYPWYNWGDFTTKVNK